MKLVPNEKKALSEFGLALGAALTAKPLFQAFFDNDYSSRVRIHHITDERGIVVESFSSVGALLKWLLDHDLPHVVCHTDKGAYLLVLKHLKPFAE